MREFESDHKSWSRSKEFDFSDSDTIFFFLVWLFVCMIQLISNDNIKTTHLWFVNALLASE